MRYHLLCPSHWQSMGPNQGAAAHLQVLLPEAVAGHVASQQAARPPCSRENDCTAAVPKQYACACAASMHTPVVTPWWQYCMCLPAASQRLLLLG